MFEAKLKKDKLVKSELVVSQYVEEASKDDKVEELVD